MGKKKRVRKRSARAKQLEMEFSVKGWGGFRRGAGGKKKPKGDAGVSHEKREELGNGQSVHVTMKLREGLPSLRQRAEHSRLRKVLRAAQKEGFRIIHFAGMSNHLHMIIEADGTAALSRGMTGFGARVARNLNKLWQRAGSVFKDRYHLLVLRGPTMVRNAIRYVLQNHLKHGCAQSTGQPDPYSSAEYFDGWKECAPVPLGPDAPVVAPRTFCLIEGWRRAAGGLLSLFDGPAAGRKPRPATRSPRHAARTGRPH